MLTRIPNTKAFGTAQRGIAGFSVPLQFKRQDNIKPHYPTDCGNYLGIKAKANPEKWEAVGLNLPTDIETALLNRQLKKRPETPDEKALEAVGKELKSRGYPVILRLHRGSGPRLFVGEKIQVVLKWEMEPYLAEEQPEFYAETEYYLDEVCLEIWVCTVCVESTMCFSNFLAKMNELKTLNPSLF